MKHKYRIMTDCYLGYEAQVRFWWFPFMWFQMCGNAGLSNTHSTVEKAEAFIRTKANRCCVKEVDI